MSSRGHNSRRTRRRALGVVAFLAVGVGWAAYLTGAWTGIEDASVDLRFSLRSVKPPHNIVIVAIDDKTLNAIPQRWPFPRSLDARAVDVLHADHARAIAYDVQFTQPTVEREDLALYHSIARASGVVLATTEIGAHGETTVLGGEANLARAHARAAAANFRANSSGVIQKYSYAIGGLRSFAVATAEQATGHTLTPREFDHGSAWIDFPGPLGTIPVVSFSDLVQGRLRPKQIEGKIAVIGATAPVLQDIHATSVTTSTPMPGPEVQADAIATAMQGNPLHEAPGWLSLLTIMLAGIATPLACMRLRSAWALALGLIAAAAYALASQIAFDSNLIVLVTYPLAALGMGTLGALIVSYASEAWEHQLADRYAETLESTVEERTAELSATQLEVIHRLARAAELRDENTGAHIERVGRMCEQLALQAGMPPIEAKRLRIASTLHDVGKIGVADDVLLHPGELNTEQWEAVKAHTRTGAALLAGSPSPLLQMAEVIARTHHERWDGSGYPNGLCGSEIPLVGRICSVCDVFDALSTRRPYKDPWPLELVIAEFTRKRGTQFDPDLVDTLLTMTATLEREHALASAPRPPSEGPGLVDRRGSAGVRMGTI
jgi:CHASE2 domain-containing sensor protein